MGRLKFPAAAAGNGFYRNLDPDISK